MGDTRELVLRHFAALSAEAAANGVPQDVVGRLLLDEIIRVWRATRSLKDIESELDFVRSNLDPGEDYAFMRP